MKKYRLMILLILLLLAIGGIPDSCFGQVYFPAYIQSTGGGAPTSTTYDNSNKADFASASSGSVDLNISGDYVVVFCATSENDRDHSTCTIGGVSATKIAEETPNYWMTLSAWKLDNPGTGTKTCTVNLSGTSPGSIMAISFVNGNSTSDEDWTSSASATSLTRTLSSASNQMCVSAWFHYDLAAISFGDGLVSRQEWQTTYGDNRCGLATKVGSASTTMDASWSGSFECMQITVAVQP